MFTLELELLYLDFIYQKYVVSQLNRNFTYILFSYIKI